jgi:hypothetical protein
MIRLWNRWVDACARREVGTTLALFRIWVGVLIAYDAARLLWAGILDPLYVPIAEGGLATVARPHVLLGLLGGATGDLVTGMTVAIVALGVVLATGLAGRLPALLLLVLLLAIKTVPINIYAGFDRLVENGLWILVLADSTATLSLACWRRGGTWTSDRTVLAFPRHFLVLQLVVLYVFTGLKKEGSAWEAPYEAVYRILQQAHHARWDLAWTADLYPVMQAMTWTTQWWEITFWVVGLAYLARQGFAGDRLQRGARRFDLRIPYLLIGVGFHVGLWVSLDVGIFSPATLAYYIAFIDPSEWARLGSKLRRLGTTPR